MREEREYLVVKDNDFIQKASYNLTAEQQKFLCYVISKIKPTDKEFERYTISALDFAELAGIDKRNVYTEFKRMMDAFDEKSQWIRFGDEEMKFRVFNEPTYNKSQGSVTVILNSQLKKKLLELSHNYTMYELWNILSLRSKYSIRLYELFKSYCFKKEVMLDYEELKSLLCAENYSIYANFKARVLDISVKEINKFTNLLVDYTIRKTGKNHKVTGINFKIKAKDTLESYKAYIETKARINEKNGQIPGQISLFDEDIKGMYLKVDEHSNQ